MEQEDSAGPFLQQEGEKRHVGLLGVARTAGQNQVVGPVVGRLSLAGADVVQGDDLWIGLIATVGADRSMSFDEPIAMGLIGAPAGTAEGA